MFILYIHKDKARKKLFLSATITFNKKNLLYHKWKKTIDDEEETIY